MKKSNSLKDRLRKSYESKDRGAGTRPSAMNWKLVEDIKFYKPKEGKNKIDIIPYEIKTKNDPLVRTGDAKVGDQSYMLDLWIHSNIGPTQAQVICNKENFGKPCPICEQRQQFYTEGKKEEAGALKAKRRCYYNIRDSKNTDEIFIWDVSHELFEKELIGEAKRSSEDGEIIDFVDPDDGTSIIFYAEETESVIGNRNVKYFEYKSFKFPEREEVVGAKLVKKAVSFDELMILNTYDEAKKILYGEEDDEDEDEKPVKGKSKKPIVEEDDEEDEDEDIDDEEDFDESDDEEEESDEDDDEDDEPASKTKAKTKPVTKKSSSASKCPNKHKFGVDCDKYPDDCDECDEWADCKKENKKLKTK